MAIQLQRVYLLIAVVGSVSAVSAQDCSDNDNVAVASEELALVQRQASVVLMKYQQQPLSAGNDAATGARVESTTPPSPIYDDNGNEDNDAARSEPDTTSWNEDEADELRQASFLSLTYQRDGDADVVAGLSKSPPPASTTHDDGASLVQQYQASLYQRNADADTILLDRDTTGEEPFGDDGGPLVQQRQASVYQSDAVADMRSSYSDPTSEEPVGESGPSPVAPTNKYASSDVRC
jgi:hypothetical protein